MDCTQFKKMSVNERIDFSTKQILCKTHVIKERICKWKCRAKICGKKHHTVLHQDDTQQEASINNTFSQQNQKIDSIKFLQVIPVEISNGSRMLEVNVLLEAGSDATLITSNISNAISKSVTVKSKLVTFSILSRASTSTQYMDC